MVRNCAVVAFIYVIAGANTAVGESWFLSESSSCEGSSVVASAIAQILPRSSGSIKITRAGNFAFYLPPDIAKEISSGPPKVIKQETLSVETARILRSALLTAGSATVPVSFKFSSSVILSYLFPHPVVGEASQSLFDIFFGEIDKSAAKSTEVAGYISSGGSLVRLASARLENNTRYMLEYTLYKVSVGDELRVFGLRACRAPLSINVKRFRSKGVNDYETIIHKLPDNSWEYWDVDDNKKSVWIFKEEQPTYYEFSSHSGERVNRLSTTGGAWTFNTLSDQEFRNIDLSIMVE